MEESSIDARFHADLIDRSVFVAADATIRGNVTVGGDSSVWFGAVVRGDVNTIVVGNNTNIQDNVTIHGTYEKSSTTIGNNVSIGHNAVIHGCTIEDDVLIGIGAVILDNAIVKSGSIIAAGSVVLANTVVDSNCVYGGIPVKSSGSLINGTVRQSSYDRAIPLEGSVVTGNPTVGEITQPQDMPTLGTAFGNQTNNEVDMSQSSLVGPPDPPVSYTES